MRLQRDLDCPLDARAVDARAGRGLLPLIVVPRVAGSVIWGLGACQCVFWGLLYYGFPVWQVPIQQDTGLSAAQLAAVFSLGLLWMALLAPHVGQAFDRGHGRAVIRAGLLAACSGLLLLASAQSLWALVLAWLLIGTAMAGLLYESAFALVQRAVDDAGQRLRALAAVTVMGGLASTLFLPLLGWMVEASDWRIAVVAAAAGVFVAGVAMECWILPQLPQLPAQAVVTAAAAPRARPGWRAPLLQPMVAVFTGSTFAAMVLITLLVPHLLARGVSLTVAASVLATLGLAQLPGRIWMLRGSRKPSAAALSVGPLLLQALGLIVVAVAGAPASAALGVAVFGLGAGLHTLARPWLVQLHFTADAGLRNGQVAQAQGFGRALGPAMAVGLASVTSMNVVLLASALALLLLIPLALRVGRALPGQDSDQVAGNAATASE